MAEYKKQWYVLRAISGKENKVEEYINNALVSSSLFREYVSQVLIPREKVITLKNGKAVFMAKEGAYTVHVLKAPEGYIGKYHKQNPAGTEAFEMEASREPCPVFDTPIGKIGLLICYDKVFPAVVRRMKLKGAEIVLSPTAWPGMNRKLGRLDLMMQYHRWSGTNRALENGVVFVDANHSSHPGVNRGAEGGHSRIIHPLRGVLAETGWEEAYAAAEIDPQAAVAEYYAKLGLTEKTHLQRLREAQTRYEKRKLLRDVIAVNIRFYARAGAAFVSDLFSALHWRIRTARAKKRG